MKKNIYILFILIITNNSLSQTLGVISNNSTDSYNGYTLFTPFKSNHTYLINNCGQVVHKWTSSQEPAASVYLLENGNLLRTGKVVNNNFNFGGAGGKVELLDWEGNLIWEYIYSTSNHLQHHDVYPLPNGNILLLAVTLMTEAEAIQAGRNPNLINNEGLYNEQIIELEPVGSNQANIVWEWNIKDHLIQDLDNTKDNYGVIADNPQLLNINYLDTNTFNVNWLHVNSLQYNATLDQIIISTRLLSEIYIIDHSTTTVEAASHTGGTYGKGGDFLYRWGNPEAYGQGTSLNKKLSGQHYPHWIPNGFSDAGKLMIFNNGIGTAASSVVIIEPTQSSPGIYTYNAGYPPNDYSWSYTDPTPTNFFSGIMSSGQRLPNGNTLICDGDSGYFFEIDENKNIVWEYVNPDSNNGILTQGDEAVSNVVFRARKLPLDYPAFDGKTLIPGNPIEINFDISSCSLLSVDKNDIFSSLQTYPNPVLDILTIHSNQIIDKIEISNLFGKTILTSQKPNSINLKNLASGIYIVKFYIGKHFEIKKIIKK